MSIHRRDLMKVAAGVVGGSGMASTASADGGWSNNGTDEEAECIYSRSCQYTAENVQFITEYQLEALCSAVPLGTGIWSTGAAAIDPVPGNAILLGVATTASAAACEFKDGFIDMHGTPQTVEVYEWTSSGDGVEPGDRYLRPGRKRKDWWSLW